MTALRSSISPHVSWIPKGTAIGLEVVEAAGEEPIPVLSEKSGWYFFDEAGHASKRFKTEREALTALDEYAKDLEYQTGAPQISRPAEELVIGQPTDKLISSWNPEVFWLPKGSCFDGAVQKKSGWFFGDSGELSRRYKTEHEAVTALQEYKAWDSKNAVKQPKKEKAIS